MSYSESITNILTQISNDEKVKNYLKKLDQNKSNLKYEDIESFTKVLGNAISRYLKPVAEQLQPEEIKAVYQHISDVVIRYSNKAAKNITGKAGVNLVPDVTSDVKADINDMLNHLVKRIKDSDKWEDVKFLVEENSAKSITRKASTSHMKFTSRMQEKAGLKVLISRDEGGTCCEWCRGISGTYTSFDSLPDNFWAVHQGCSCVFHYNVGKTNDFIKFITNEDGTINKITENL